MKPPARTLAPALAAALATLPAQDHRAATEDLPQLRAAFAAAKTERAAVIAVVPGREPVILTAGSDAAGKDLTPQTLVPLLALAKWLAADAIHVQQKGRIDTGSGEKLGLRELTVRELLDGVTLLPDYYVLDGGDGAADAALLRQCGAMAAGARMELHGSGLGAPEFVLLEPLAFGGRDKDWPSMIRSTLAPGVPGLDPLGADALAPEARGRTILAAEDLAKLAAARPAVLRTLLTLQNLGTWLQWRTQQAAPVWNSARMGRLGPSLTQASEQRWVTGSSALGVVLTLLQYPSRKAALFWIAPPRHTLSEPLQRAFEGELYGDPEEARDTVERLPAGLAAAQAGGRPDRSVPRALEGTRWCSVTADGAKAMQLAFGASAKEPLVLTSGSETLSFSLLARMGDGLRATPVGRADAMYWLWLRPEPDAEKPTKLLGVLSTARSTGKATAGLSAAGASVPLYFELVPDKD